jgi:hypothetical protein
MHAMRVGIHSTMGSSPGNLVFNRDMFLNIPLIADWHAITLKQEHLINENLMKKIKNKDVMIIFLSRKYLRKHGNPKNWELGQHVLIQYYKHM